MKMKNESFMIEYAIWLADTSGELLKKENRENFWKR